MDDERLCKEFSPFGTITSTKVIMEEATKAVTEMNGSRRSDRPTIPTSTCTYTPPHRATSWLPYPPRPLTASMLATAPPQEQKQMLGERLFPLIQNMHPSPTGKITGMLLDQAKEAALKSTTHGWVV